MSEILRAIWRITPLHPPRPLRHCGTCKATTPFVGSGRFRTNAQKKRLDVWLIYRCAVCDETWNLPIVERCPVARIPPDQLHAFMHNDPVAAARHAFDLARLALYCAQVEQDMAAAVDKQIDGGELADATCLEIVMALSLPCRLRLDVLLARELHVTRNAILRAHESGAIALDSPKALRAPVFDGQRVHLDLAQARRWGIDVSKLRNGAT